MVEQSSESFLLPFPCCLPHTVQSLGHAQPALSWPSRIGLDHTTKAHWRSPGSRACCFAACAGFLDYAGPSNHSRPAHRYLCLRFTRHLAVSPARLEARMESLSPFLSIRACGPRKLMKIIPS